MSDVRYGRLSGQAIAVLPGSVVVCVQYVVGSGMGARFTAAACGE